MTKARAVVFQVTTENGKEDVPGWIVPDTDDLLAVDIRYDADLTCLESADWAITHIPTGRRVNSGWMLEAGTRADAIRIAQRFYAAYKARGWDLRGDDPDAITEPVKRLSKEEHTALFAEIGEWKEAKGAANDVPSESEDAGQ